MKELIDYCWKHKMLEGIPENVEVIDTGLQNRHKGPDFFNAKIRIGSTMWVGNVVTLDKASDWNEKGFDKDEKYKNVVLIVVLEDDAEMMNANGDLVSYIVPSIPEMVNENYQRLMEDGYDECLRYNSEHCSRLMYHSWMAALQTEWLDMTTNKAIVLYKTSGSWTDTHFVMLAREFGQGVNEDIYEKWAKQLNFEALRHHQDDLFQLEAMMLGTAGLLELDAIPEECQKEALNEGYFAKLRNEYMYLAHKYGLPRMDHREWRGGMNPHYTPQRCISWLANWFYMCKDMKVESLTFDELRSKYSSKVTPYWITHSQFGRVGDYGELLRKILPNDLIMKVAAPFYFACGRETHNEDLCDNAFDLMEQGAVMVGGCFREWRSYGFPLYNGGDCLGVIQQREEYCAKKQCLRCRFGYEYFKNFKA